MRKVASVDSIYRLSYLLCLLNDFFRISRLYLICCMRSSQIYNNIYPEKLKNTQNKRTKQQQQMNFLWQLAKVIYYINKNLKYGSKTPFFASFRCFMIVWNCLFILLLLLLLLQLFVLLLFSAFCGNILLYSTWSFHFESPHNIVIIFSKNNITTERRCNIHLQH